MSPWDVIGWAIAIPFAFLTFLFLLAFVVGVFRWATKKEKKPEPTERRLRIVEDDEPA